MTSIAMIDAAVEKHDQSERLPAFEMKRYKKNSASFGDFGR